MQSSASAVDAVRETGIANAGLLLGALLLALAWLQAERGPTAFRGACRHPVEISQQGGRTVAVRCASRPQSGASLRGPAALLFGRPIDVNRADSATLTSLPGIGKGRARAIVDERAAEPFAGLEDLERVPGIGPRTVAGLRGWAVAGPRASPARGRSAPDEGS
jgi:competence protein ComEA